MNDNNEPSLDDLVSLSRARAPLTLDEPLATDDAATLDEEPAPAPQLAPLTLEDDVPIIVDEPAAGVESSSEAGELITLPRFRASMVLETFSSWRERPLTAEPASHAHDEKRRARRVSAPLPAALTERVTWDKRPVHLVDISRTGARVATRPHPSPRAGEIMVVEVRAFGLTAHLAGRVRWVRGGECGVAFDETLMTRGSKRLLERILGPDTLK